MRAEILKLWELLLRDGRQWSPEKTQEFVQAARELNNLLGMSARPAAEIDRLVRDTERALCPCGDPAPKGSRPCTFERPCPYGEGMAAERWEIGQSREDTER
jgi:hypothetical protein